MAQKAKYYVVWKGNKSGIYDSWEECKLQIKNFPGAIYKSFKTKNEAIEAFNSNPANNISKKESKIKKNNNFKNNKPILDHSIAVDAACSGNPGDMEYRGVITATGKELFRQGPYADGTNNIGEFLAIVHALGSLKKMGKENILIYTDSKTAMAWVRNKKAKTTLQPTPRNQLLFELINRAEMWLKNNNYKNKIVKWETKSWGEIPADFGRK